MGKQPKKVLPHEEVILAYFGTVPRQFEDEWEGQKKFKIGFRFQIADTKYPDLIGHSVWRDENAIISAGGKKNKPTRTHELCEAMAGHRLSPDWDYVDTALVTEEQWQGLYGYYWLQMDEPVFKDDGSLHFQEIKDVYNPSKFPFPPDSRKVEKEKLERVVPTGPIGLPKAHAPVQTPPAATGPTTPVAPAPPKVEPPKTEPAPQGKPEAEPIANVIASIQELWKPESPLRQVLADFLTAKGKAKVKELPEAEIRLLYTIMLIASYMVSDPKYETEVAAMLEKWHQKLVELKQSGADLLLKRLGEMASGTDPFAAKNDDPFAD